MTLIYLHLCDLSLGYDIRFYCTRKCILIICTFSEVRTTNIYKYSLIYQVFVNILCFSPNKNLLTSFIYNFKVVWEHLRTYHRDDETAQCLRAFFCSCKRPGFSSKHLPRPSQPSTLALEDPYPLLASTSTRYAVSAYTDVDERLIGIR